MGALVNANQTQATTVGFTRKSGNTYSLQVNKDERKRKRHVNVRLQVAVWTLLEPINYSPWGP